MPATYEPIGNVTLTGTSSSVSFTSISGSYTDLVILSKFAFDGSSQRQIRMRFNDDTGSNYYEVRYLLGVDNTVITTRNAPGTSMNVATGPAYAGGVDNGFCTAEMNINNYASTAFSKIVFTPQGFQDTTQYGEAGYKVGQWWSTSAITKIQMYPSSGNFRTGSTFTLYQITKA